MESFQNLEERQLSSEEIFDGEVVHLFKDHIVIPNGNIATREVIRHVGAVAIVPVTEDGKVVIEHQFRYPVYRVVTEIPAGKLDSKQEDHLEAAKRELKEETGITADQWTEIGVYHPAAAYCDEAVTMYIARGLHMGKQKLDDDEFLNIEFVSMEELVSEIMEGKITDGKTQAAILKAYLMLKKGAE